MLRNHQAKKEEADYQGFVELKSEGTFNLINHNVNKKKIMQSDQIKNRK